MINQLQRWLESIPLPAGVAANLICLAESGEWVLLLGAGVSIDAGLPSARQLASALANGLSQRSSLPTVCFEGLADLILLEPAIQILSDHLGPDAASATVSLLDSPHLLASHHFVAALVASGCVRRILTTNFDTLVERAACEYRPLTPLLRTPRKRLRYADHQATLLKLHGDAENPRSAITTVAEYLRGYSRTIVNYVERWLNGSALLIAGYAGWDLDFSELVKASSASPAVVLWIDLKDEAQLLLDQNSSTYRDRIAAQRRLALAQTFRQRGAQVVFIKANIHEVAQAIVPEISHDIHPLTENRWFDYLGSCPRHIVDLLAIDVLSKMAPRRLRFLHSVEFVTSVPDRTTADRAAVIIGEVLIRGTPQDQLVGEQLLKPIVRTKRISTLVACAALWLSELSFARGNWDSASGYIQLAMESSPPRLRSLMRLFATNIRLFWTSGKLGLESMLASPVDIARLRKKVHTNEELTLFLGTLRYIASSYHFLGRVNEALEVDRAYLEIAATAGNPAAIGRALGGIGACMMGLSDVCESDQRRNCLEDATKWLQDAMVVLAESDSILHALAQGNLGETQVALGYVEEGLITMRKAIRALRGLRHLPYQVYFMAVLSESYLKLGRLERGVITATQSVYCAVLCDEWGEGSRGLAALMSAFGQADNRLAARVMRKLALKVATEHGNYHVLNRLHREDDDEEGHRQTDKTLP